MATRIFLNRITEATQLDKVIQRHGLKVLFWQVGRLRVDQFDPTLLTKHAVLVHTRRQKVRMLLNFFSLNRLYLNGQGKQNGEQSLDFSWLSRP